MVDVVAIGFWVHSAFQLCCQLKCRCSTRELDGGTTERVRNDTAGKNGQEKRNSFMTVIPLGFFSIYVPWFSL